MLIGSLVVVTLDRARFPFGGTLSLSLAGEKGGGAGGWLPGVVYVREPHATCAVRLLSLRSSSVHIVDVRSAPSDWTTEGQGCKVQGKVCVTKL